LARDMIRMSGHREGEIPIVFSGLRPGEKLYEELLADADETLPSAHPRLRIARLGDASTVSFMRGLEVQCEAASIASDARTIKAWLSSAVGEYKAQ